MASPNQAPSGAGGGPTKDEDSSSLSQSTASLASLPKIMSKPSEARKVIERSCAESEQEAASGPARKVYNSRRIIEKAFIVLDELRRSRHLCDIVIRVGSSEFHSHRVVLAATSPYFQAMFTSKSLLFNKCRQSIAHFLFLLSPFHR